MAQFAELLRNSYWAGDATYADLATRASHLATQLAYDEDVVEFSQLVQRVAN